MCRKSKLALAALSLSGCMPRTTHMVRVNHPRVSYVAFADSRTVQEQCYRVGGLLDSGKKVDRHTELNGCYKPSTGGIWISLSCNISKVLTHELAHAITDLTEKEVGEGYPVECPPQATYGKTYVGGSYKALGER